MASAPAHVAPVGGGDRTNYDETVELGGRILLWVAFSVLIPIVPFSWDPIATHAGWTGQIDHGELLLVAVVLTAGAAGYAATAPVTSTRGEFAKSAVVGSALILLVLQIGVYSSFREGPSTVNQSATHIAWFSCVFFGLGVLLGLVSTCLVYFSEVAKRSQQLSAGVAG